MADLAAELVMTLFDLLAIYLSDRGEEEGKYGFRERQMNK